MFLKGVIEGFYGRSWPNETRVAYADYLAQLGLNTYLYAPKSDPVLRRQWRDEWSVADRDSMAALGMAHRERGILWGVGLSPMELYLNYGARERTQLQQKVRYLMELEMPLLGILFDDMPGDCADLALRQAEIVRDIRHWAPDVRLLVCPTYYSYDRDLEKYFGEKPADYWPELGQALPDDVDIFWTGNRVCSTSITGQDIANINSQLGRPVILWDNYPVNDGAKRSNFLYLKALANRDECLAENLTGHLCNPMNQGVLSLAALRGLAELYGSKVFSSWLPGQGGAATWDQLMANAEEFEQQGLSGMGKARCEELAAVYGHLPGQAAREAQEWLQGAYEFDPACLTG